MWMLVSHNGSQLFWHVNPTQIDEHPALSEGIGETEHTLGL